MSYDLTILENGCAELGIELTQQQKDQYIQYYEYLIEKNKVMNLTGITEFQEVLTKHFLDSLSCVKAVDMTKVKTIIDIGTGAGFPGIPPPLFIRRMNTIRSTKSTMVGRSTLTSMATISLTASGASEWNSIPVPSSLSVS